MRRNPLLSKKLGARVHGLRDAIREEEEDVARAQAHNILPQNALELGAAIQGEPEPIGRQDVRLGFGAVRGDMKDGVVSRARISHVAFVHVDDSIGHRDETPAVESRREDLVGFDEKFAGRMVNLAQGQSEPLELRHVKRRRRAFSGDVRDEEREPSVAQRNEVVVVTADFIGGKTEGRDGKTGDVDAVSRQ